MSRAITWIICAIVLILEVAIIISMIYIKSVKMIVSCVALFATVDVVTVYSLLNEGEQKDESNK